MPNTKQIIIVENGTLLRQSLENMFALDSNFEVVGIATNGKDAIELANSIKPNLMIIDLSLPLISGIDAITEIKKRNPLIKVLALSDHLDKQYVYDALRAGVDGYLVKYDTNLELMYAVKNILNGKAYLSPYVINIVIAVYLAKNINPNEDLLWRTVTLREREILKLVAEGYKNQVIANLLHLSLDTVKTHRTNIMKKLSLHNIISLTAYAIGKDLVTINKDSGTKELST